MSFLLSSELEDVSVMLGNFFAEKSKVNSAQEFLNLAQNKNKNEEIWEELFNLGVIGCFLPEEFSGLNLGNLSLGVLIEKASAELFTLPLIETAVFGAWIINRFAGLENKKKFLSEIIQQKKKFTAAFSILENSLVVQKKEDQYLLSGDLKLVPALEAVDYLIVPVFTQKKQIDLFLLDLKKEKLEFKEEDCFDLLRKYYQITLKDNQAKLINEQHLEVLDLENPLGVFSAVELSAIATRVLVLSTDYVKTRKQFAQHIGGFQAIQHKLADMCLVAEQLNALTRFALWCMDNDPKQFNQSALAVKGFASEMVPQLVESAIQVHGGIGFTYEYPLHLYLRRALTISMSYISKSKCYQLLSAEILKKLG